MCTQNDAYFNSKRNYRGQIFITCHWQTNIHLKAQNKNYVQNSTIVKIVFFFLFCIKSQIYCDISDGGGLSMRFFIHQIFWRSPLYLQSLLVMCRCGLSRYGVERLWNEMKTCLNKCRFIEWPFCNYKYKTKNKHRHSKWVDTFNEMLTSYSVEMDIHSNCFYRSNSKLRILRAIW